jgi:EAL domain-containing protein (putative c-di-GMP-specific phosphodiesterase class I)
MGDLQRVREILAPFLDFGLGLALDDFGGGYSSFKYLARLPVQFLKIEGDLVRLASSEPRVRAIINGI